MSFREGMSIHEGFLELAAAAIDFDLDEYERAELDRHLAGCDACRETIAAYRDDAAAIASEAGPQLSPARSVAILADALLPPRSPSPLRFVAIAVVVAVLGVGLGAVGMAYIQNSQDPLVAVAPSPSASTAPLPPSGPTPGLTDPAPTPQPPAGTSHPAEPPSPGALPVTGSAQELGTQIRMAPGANDDLYVSIPVPGGTVLVTLLDSTGRPTAGWPIVLNGTTSCEGLLPVDDGSVRLLCTLENPEGNRFSGVRAYGFDSKGGTLAGWPIDLADHGADGYFAGRVLGDELTVLAWETLGDQIQEGQPAGNAWIVRAAADGTVRGGAKVPYGTACCSDTWAVGPDGVAYGTIQHVADPPAETTSELAAVSPEGVASGFPVAIEGIASEPAFDAAGRIHVTVAPVTDAAPFGGPARTLVFDPDGRAGVGSSDELQIVATGECVGVEGTCVVPAAPLVGPDGTTFVINVLGNSTTVAGVSPSGRVMTGWPFRSNVGLQGTGFCREGEVCETRGLSVPAIGPGNVLYLLRAAADPSAGGSILAVGQDGRVVDGWPVSLLRPGAEFWTVVVGPDGTAYVLAIEPEPNDGYSATILYLGPDSIVLDKATIIEP